MIDSQKGGCADFSKNVINLLMGNCEIMSATCVCDNYRMIFLNLKRSKVVTEAGSSAPSY